MKIFKYLALIFIFILNFTSCFNCSAALASNKGREVVEYFDLRSYHPEQFGLKDLVFEVRISNLMDILSKALTIGDVKDVYFKVFWLFPGKYEIKVMGLPKGFKEIKKELQNILKVRLDYVIPKKVSPLLRSYKLKLNKRAKNTFIKAVDETNTKNVNEIHMLFTEKGMLESIKTFSPTGVKIANLNLSQKSWSHNKWVLDKIKVQTILGLQKTTITSEIKYLSIAGHGFPEVVEMVTLQELTGSQSLKGKSTSKKIQSSLKFSNFEVNTGRAYKEVMRKVKSEI